MSPWYAATLTALTTTPSHSALTLPAIITGSVTLNTSKSTVSICAYGMGNGVFASLSAWLSPSMPSDSVW